MKYLNRHNAGRLLAKQLEAYANREDVVVLALPRGGVPVAYEIAVQLSLKLDVFIVRKLGVPMHAELAMGAIASGGITIFNQSIIESTHISQSSIDKVILSEQKELMRRELLYHQNQPVLPLSGKTIILVDDGIATGATMLAAIRAIQQKKPKALLVAVPVAARDTCKKIELHINKLICLLKPIDFDSVGTYYEDFTQTTDEEVIQLLKQAALR